MEHVRPIRGASQPHRMKCSDENYYVVKFQNNPQGLRTLANERMASYLAAYLGLPVPVGSVITIDQDLINCTCGMIVRWGSPQPCRGGRCFGSRYPGDPQHSKVFDSLSDENLSRCCNISAFLGMFVFDLRTQNRDSRQAIFVRRRDHTYTPRMIDHGFCFGATEWEFLDKPFALPYGGRSTYSSACTVNQFEVWLSRIETEINESVLRQAAAAVPEEWFQADFIGLYRVVERLDQRRKWVRAEAEVFARSEPRFFPNWGTRKRYSRTNRSALQPTTPGLARNGLGKKVRLTACRPLPSR
jgi:hypothetical protein